MSEAAKKTVNILIYSDSATVRRDVMRSLGETDGEIAFQWTAAATATGAQDKVENGAFDLIIVDSETTKISGLVLARTLHEELDEVPPIIAILARPQDEWLSEFSKVDVSVEYPLNPLKISAAVHQALKLS